MMGKALHRNAVPVYVINLARRRDKLDRISQGISESGLEFTRTGDRFQEYGI